MNLSLDIQQAKFCSLFSVLCSLFSVLCSLFSVLCSLFSVLCSLFSGIGHQEWVILSLCILQYVNLIDISFM